ncbi:peptidoglycan recognition protein 1-like isoform X2 [Macrosteles quadrilineatus]|uniref:peptidoglycan recognition protein 1-like isoform X2 n=1 Tax=Macrosteles quadrilineatus TaxID=74068 RepID=UPI0023E27868|nr:peptidoglycan recognition protein 1-like isoform X2 [Macrosteles quadrilineatus]
MDYDDYDTLPPLSASARRDYDKWIGDRREQYTDDEEDEELEQPPYYQMPTVVSRDEWGALPPFSRPPLKMPVKYIRFTCTMTPQCKHREDCDAQVRKIQQDAIQTRKIPDIDYNFLVGGDFAHIYEGRGWFVDATRPKKLQYLRGNCIDIAFIGDFTPTRYPRIFELATFPLVKLGIREKYISENISIIGMDDNLVVQPPHPTP